MTDRKKRGPKPSIWHTEYGKAFVYAVLGVQAARNPIKIVDAISIVVKSPEFRPLKSYDLRYLEKKYQEISYRLVYTRLYKGVLRSAYLRAKRELEEQNLN
jgi:hypothetical protein